MTSIDWRGAAATSLGAARRNIARFTLVLGLAYLGFAVSYLVRPDIPGASPLAWLTTGTAALLLAVAAVGWRRRPGGVRFYAWLFTLGAVVLVNINAALVFSAKVEFSISHILVVLAAAALTPSVWAFVGFTVVNLVAALVVIDQASIEAPMGILLLGYVMTCIIAGFILLARFHYISLMESLRRAVEENRDRDFRELIDENPDAVILMRDGTIVYASASLASYLRLPSAATVFGTRFDTLVVRGQDALSDLLAGRPREPSCVIELERGDGTRIAVDMAEPKVITFEGAPATMLVARDVTASQRALNARLLLADRMSATGTLAAGIAHEINNPLAYVMMNLSELDETLGPARTEDAAELLREIHDGVDRVAAIVKDLRGVSRIADEHQSAIDPGLSLLTALKMVDNQLRHRAEVVSQLEPLPPVVANDGKLVQVFMNILINAAHALDATERAHPRLEVRSAHVGNEAVIEVRDSGCGMTDDVRARVFDPFFTTKDPGQGTGLGLFFCHTVVSAIGGRIEVESDPDTGTLVRVVLPATEAATAPATPPAAVEHARGHDGFRVLVIDDEPFVGKAIGRILSHHDVTVVNNGEAALAAFRDFEPDLILCDLMMPGMSGQDVYEAIVALEPAAAQRFRFLTGGAFTPAARAFAVAMGDRVLSKPVVVSALRALVDAEAAAKRASKSADIAAG